MEKSATLEQISVEEELLGALAEMLVRPDTRSLYGVLAFCEDLSGGSDNSRLAKQKIQSLLAHRNEIRIMIHPTITPREFVELFLARAYEQGALPVIEAHTTLADTLSKPDAQPWNVITSLEELRDALLSFAKDHLKRLT